ncbi:hypothetical protein [Planctomycetes bacterium TBK1r]|uniref:Uncharacterized protein n=1 Tax=Stieleria magnilauensis TaxID=2527963 RepID=A0ABX5XYA4_9BACT|nr:hypothetical protein TBK1r_59670 [Planctomycetes bacterium TBK1r]QDV87018.1 hypothetical protein TBK1r_60450 [Planctomycetes bacterium TBK1r]
MRNQKTIAALAIVVLLLLTLPSVAADTYTPAPLQLLTERVNEHDQQICDLDTRVKILEAPKSCDPPKDDPNAKRIFQLQQRIEELESIQTEAKGIQSAIGDNEKGAGENQSPGETVVRIIIDQQSTRAEQGNIKVVSPAKVEHVVSDGNASVSKPVVSFGRRLKTPDELKREIKARYDGNLYADMSPKTPSWAKLHLTTPEDDHRYVYQRSQLEGLNWNWLWNLHNLNHSSLAINPYTSAPAAARVSPSATASLKLSFDGEASDEYCPDGQCPIRSPSQQPAASQQRNTIWFPGRKLLFGR